MLQKHKNKKEEVKKKASKIYFHTNQSNVVVWLFPLIPIVPCDISIKYITSTYVIYSIIHYYYSLNNHLRNKF